MSRIQSDTGIITGIPIKETIDKLMSVAARPRQLIESRSKTSAGEKSAIDTLSTKVLAFKFSATKFTRTTTFGTRTAVSSDSKAVSATIASGSAAPAGSYKLTPLRTAAAHQVVSSGFASLGDGVEGGELRLRFGGQLDRGASLSQLNGGEGFKGGKIRLTDRSGETATIDLRAATSVDDVLAAINASEGVSVRASVVGDRFVLTDTSGGSGTLRVQEAAGGTTAASLGLAGLSAASNTLTGADVFRLGSGTRLDALNDGLGVRVTNDQIRVDDLTVSLRDGTSAGIDLSGATTLGDVIQRINSDADLTGKVVAKVSTDGARLVVEDQTAGNAVFKVENGPLGSAADDLGIAGNGQGNTLTGRRLVSGLSDTLVSNLGGRDGLALGSIQLTDRAGATATIDLSSAETLREVIDRINNASPAVTAKVNAARNGIELVDTSAGTGSLIVADVNGGSTAAKLGIAVNGAVESVRGADLRRQSVGQATLLSSLNQGQGIKLGDVRITDSDGAQASIDLDFRGNKAPTLGDVIDAINGAAATAGVKVRAGLNDSGDGIALTDSGSGLERLRVDEVGGGTTAKSLRLLGASTETNALGQQVIDGTTSFRIDLSDLDRTDTDIPLASLRGGKGIDAGVFQVTDSTGKSAVVNTAGAQTIGDVIDRINATGLSVEAAVNSAGTGIQLTELAKGLGGLKVEDLGSGNAASQLRIESDATVRDTQGRLTIDGGGLFAAESADTSALQSVVKRINDLQGGFTAALVFDGFSQRLSITSDRSGAANELLLDGSSAGLSFSDATRPADAAAIFGPESSGGFAVTSPTNELKEIVPGLNVTVLAGTGEAVTIDVSNDRAPLVSAVKEFVESYNSIRTSVAEFTAFDSQELTTGILFGRNEALRVDVELSRIVSDRYSLGGDRRSLESIGLSVGADGKLTLSESRLTQAFNADPAAVEALFNRESTGLVARVNTAVGTLADGENSLLANRSKTIQRQIDTNNERIEEWNKRLERQRATLEKQYYALEQTISLLQTSLDSINSIASVNGSSSSSN